MIGTQTLSTQELTGQVVRAARQSRPHRSRRPIPALGAWLTRKALLRPLPSYPHRIRRYGASEPSSAVCGEGAVSVAEAEADSALGGVALDVCWPLPPPPQNLLTRCKSRFFWNSQRNRRTITIFGTTPASVPKKTRLANMSFQVYSRGRN
jgi:hypothetical protein